MDYTRTTYVEFLYPGSFVNETSAKKVARRDPASLEVPKGAFGFSYFDIVTATVTVDGQPVELASRRINESPRHYYGGEVLTRADVVAKVPNNSILLSNMDGNGWDRVIRTRTGNFQPLEATDVFVAAA